jgi:hypothetical protein
VGAGAELVRAPERPVGDHLADGGGVGRDDAALAALDRGHAVDEDREVDHGVRGAGGGALEAAVGLDSHERVVGDRERGREAGDHGEAGRRRGDGELAGAVDLADVLAGGAAGPGRTDGPRRAVHPGGPHVAGRTRLSGIASGTGARTGEQRDRDQATHHGATIRRRRQGPPLARPSARAGHRAEGVDDPAVDALVGRAVAVEADRADAGAVGRGAGRRDLGVDHADPRIDRHLVPRSCEHLRRLPGPGEAQGPVLDRHDDRAGRPRVPRRQRSEARDRLLGGRGRARGVEVGLAVQLERGPRPRSSARRRRGQPRAPPRTRTDRTSRRAHRARRGRTPARDTPAGDPRSTRGS